MMCAKSPNVGGDGRASIPLSGAKLALFHALDREFLKLSGSVTADEYHFPSFIASSDLKQIDYLHSFPHHATFPAVLDRTESNLQAFRTDTIVGAENEINVTQFAPIKEILTPAACYHFYIHFKGARFDHPIYLTTKNTCFRNEDQFVPLERQWNFTMREIVSIGSVGDIQRYLEIMQEKVTEFARALKLNFAWEIATDAFFDPANSPKHWMQRLEPNKQELVFDQRLAIGSANNHRNYFGEAFDIRVNGIPAHSACVAFGVERWVAAILDQFGPHCSDWPLEPLGLKQ